MLEALLSLQGGISGSHPPSTITKRIDYRSGHHWALIAYGVPFATLMYDTERVHYFVSALKSPEVEGFFRDGAIEGGIRWWDVTHRRSQTTDNPGAMPTAPPAGNQRRGPYALVIYRQDAAGILSQGTVSSSFVAAGVMSWPGWV